MDHTWQRSLERSRMTYGPIHRMYESSGPLIIVIPSDDLYEYAALQISHDWYMYGGGDAMIITDDVKRKEDGVYYKLYLGLPHENKQLDQLLSEKPCGVTFERNSKNKAVSIKVGNTSYKNPGTGNEKALC